MDCSEFERTLADLKEQRRELKDAMALMPPSKQPQMQAELDALNAQIDTAKADLDECEALAAQSAGKPPRPFTLKVKEIYCAQADKEWGVDEPYLIVGSVDRLGKVNLGTIPLLGPIDFSKASIHTLKIGPWTKVKAGGTYPASSLSSNPSLWDLSGKARALASPEDAIFLVALMENDGASPDAIRGAANTALEESVIANAQLDYDALVDTLASAMAGGIDVALGAGVGPGHLNFDERLDDVLPLPLTQNDLDTLAAGHPVEKSLAFARIKNSGKMTDRYTITFFIEPD